MDRVVIQIYVKYSGSKVENIYFVLLVRVQIVVCLDFVGYCFQEQYYCIFVGNVVVRLRK